jgi:hypothetical protein
MKNTKNCRIGDSFLIIGKYGYNLNLHSKSLKVMVWWECSMSVWSGEYVSAVSAFSLRMTRLTERGFPVVHERLAIGCKGPNEEDLAIDVAWIGPVDASRLLLSSSGVHGVEGFAGSAIQLSILDSLEALPEDTALAIIHIANPYGMSWLRRVNESNIDLNRNFLLPGEEYAGEPVGYARLSPLINESSAPQRKDRFFLRALWYVFRNGFSATKQAFAEGQYSRPECLQYGGSALEKGPELIIDWLETNLTSVERCLWIDLHTGLGKAGEDTLLVEFEESDPRLEELSSNFGPRITSLDPKAGIAYAIRGGMQAGVEARFPKIEWTSITQEFGTVSPFNVIKALRAENRWSQWGGSEGRDTLHHWSRKNLLDAFNMRDIAWRNRLIERGNALYADGMKHIQS